MSSTDDALKASTRAEWRTLGFFYDYDEASRVWLIRGSRAGVQRLCSELRAYARNPAHSRLSEHEHYGPYSYLEFVTWTEAKIVPEGVYGRLDDFDRLGGIVETWLHSAGPGKELRIDSEYSKQNDAVLVIRIEADGFDPAGCDPASRAS